MKTVLLSLLLINSNNILSSTSAENTYNKLIKEIRCMVCQNQNIAESGNGSGGNVDLLSNGFKIRSTWGDINNDTSTILYMAWAESPFSNNTRSK